MGVVKVECKSPEAEGAQSDEGVGDMSCRQHIDLSV